MDTANTNSDVIEVNDSSTISDKIYTVAEKVAATSLGQYTIRKVDGALRTIEKTAKWSLPQIPEGEGDEDKAVLRPALERPLPWFIFLPALVSMRIFRVGLTFGALLMGKDPVGPSTVVRFLQTRRRKLRALKYNGLRSIRTRNANKTSDGKNKGYLTNIYKLICGLACSTAAIPEDGIKMIVKKSKKNKSELEENHEEGTESKKRGVADMDEEDDEEDEVIEDYAKNLVEGPVLEDESDSSFDDEKASSSSDDSLEETSDTEDVKHTMNNKDSEANKKENTVEAKKDDKTNGTEAPLNKIESPKKKPSSPIAVKPAKLSPKIAEKINSLLAQNGGGEYRFRRNRNFDVPLIVYESVDGFNSPTNKDDDEKFYSPIDSPPLVMENDVVESPATHIKRVDSVENGNKQQNDKNIQTSVNNKNGPSLDEIRANFRAQQNQKKVNNKKPNNNKKVNV